MHGSSLMHACMHLVLSLFDKYSRDSIAARILDVVARAEWKSLWETALRLAKRETDKSIKARSRRVQARAF